MSSWTKLFFKFHVGCAMTGAILGGIRHTIASNQPINEEFMTKEFYSASTNGATEGLKYPWKIIQQMFKKVPIIKDN